MKKYFLLCALFPFVSGMTDKLPEIKPIPREVIVRPCLRRCLETERECYNACNRWAFFRLDNRELEECDKHCRANRDFCEILCFLD